MMDTSPPPHSHILASPTCYFADDRIPLDERMTTSIQTLTDAQENTWTVEVPTFADPRLNALLKQQREAELTQAALRGRPFDYPEAQIILLFGLPLPNLPPTEVRERTGSAPTSNQGRTTVAQATIENAVQSQFAAGKRVVSVEDLSDATGMSVVTVRKHMASVAGRLGIRLIQQRRTISLPRGGQRIYARAVLVRRGRWVPPPEPVAFDKQSCEIGMDHACDGSQG